MCVFTALLIAPLKTPSNVRPLMVSPDDEVTAPSNDGGSSDPAVGDLIGDLFNDNAPAVADAVAGRASTSKRQS